MMIGAEPQMLTPDQADQAWRWVTDAGPQPEWAPDDLRWLHATFDDGLVWGERRDRRWVTADGFGSLVVVPRVEALWELRLFGPTAELSLWCDLDTGLGSLTGRLIKELDDPLPRVQRPFTEQRILVGDRVRPHQANGNGFTLVAEQDGTAHVVPFDVDGSLFAHGDWWPLRLTVRHYVEPHPETGALRIGGSRLVDLRCVTPGDQS